MTHENNPLLRNDSHNKPYREDSMPAQLINSLPTHPTHPCTHYSMHYQLIHPTLHILSQLVTNKPTSLLHNRIHSPTIPTHPPAPTTTLCITNPQKQPYTHSSNPISALPPAINQWKKRMKVERMASGEKSDKRNIWKE